MVEQDLTISENGKYKNLYLKPSPSKGALGIDNGNHIIVTKTFVDGKEFPGKWGPSYLCAAEYKSEKCSFFLNQREHDIWKTTGGQGDKVKISLTERTVMTKTGKKIVADLAFNLVE